MTSIRREWPLIIGIAAMVLLVWGTFAVPGSLLQKVLFVIGAPVLGVTAFFNKQKMFTVIQLVVTIGAVLGFFTGINQLFKYVLMLGAALVSILYLVRIGYFKEDKWGVVGSVGLLCFAYAFATDAASAPVLFNSLILIGGLLVAFYSSIAFFIEKVRIAFIWIVLNLLLCINPVLILF